MLPDIKKGKDMINILPFEIISRNTKTLLITYISSVDITHEGMKKVLKAYDPNRVLFLNTSLINYWTNRLLIKTRAKSFLLPQA